MIRVGSRSASIRPAHRPASPPHAKGGSTDSGMGLVGPDVTPVPTLERYPDALFELDADDPDVWVEGDELPREERGLYGLIRNQPSEVL